MCGGDSVNRLAMRARGKSKGIMTAKIHVSFVDGSARESVETVIPIKVVDCKTALAIPHMSIELTLVRELIIKPMTDAENESNER